MPAHIALLRGVNVGGHKPVAMSALRELFVQLGFADVRTFIQSGNVVFRSDARTGAEIERLLEIEADRRLGLRTEFLIRTAREWDDIVAGNPFGDEAERDPGKHVVMFLRGAPEAASVQALRAAVAGPESVHTLGREAYVAYPAGIGASRLTNAVIERALGLHGTSRNWNTVRKLAALATAVG
jgi:uncharacterized protein (DUF1697 family)